MNELIIKDFKEQLPEIKSNFEEVKQELSASLDKYRNLVFTDENIADGKAELAKLRKLKSSIDGYRKDVKKVWNEPYMVFEDQMKELTGLVDEPINAINEQVKDYEKREKEAKEQNIKDIYEVLAQETEESDYLDFGKLWNDRWLNKTYKIEDIKAEIKEALKNNLEAVKAIKGLKDNYIPEYLDVYRRTQDLQEVFKEQSRLKRLDEERAELLKKRQEEKERREAEQRARQEAEQKAKQEAERFAEDSKMLEQEEIKEPQPEPEENIYTVKFEIKATKEQLKLISDLFEKQNIQFKVIKD